MSDYLNEKPSGEYVEVYVSDWNREHWSFYAYIALDSYEEDLHLIHERIEELNWRGGDVYVELIDRSAGLADFYEFLGGESLSHWSALDARYWDLLAEHGNEHYKAFNKLVGGSDFCTLRGFEYSVFDSYEEMFEVFYPDTYKHLEETGLLYYMDFEAVFGDSGAATEIDGRIYLQ